MITHVVLFRARPTVAAEGLAKARDALASLADRVPEIRSLSVGVNVLDSDRAYDLALVASFDDLEALQRYRRHPDHVVVASAVDELCASTVSVDFDPSEALL